MTISQQLEKMWSDLLAFLSTLIIPDWSAVVGLLPLLILVGIVGPIFSLIVLAWLGYTVTKPRTQAKYIEGPKTAPLNQLGEPVLPSGEPYCPVDGLIYASNTVRCERDGTMLLVRCPKCDVIRESSVPSCGNCGLYLKIDPRALVVAGDGPPPGGAAAA